MGHQTNYRLCPPRVNMSKLDVVTNYMAAAVPVLILITERPNPVWWESFEYSNICTAAAAAAAAAESAETNTSMGWWKHVSCPQRSDEPCLQKRPGRWRTTAAYFTRFHHQSALASSSPSLRNLCEWADEDTCRWTLHIIRSQSWISAAVRSGRGREGKRKQEGIMPCILTMAATGVFYPPPLFIYSSAAYSELARCCWRKCPFK